jgi:hypothetical protein
MLNHGDGIMTYTVVTMEVPPEFYDMVRQKLKDAGYDHAIDDKEGILDMTHIALVREEFFCASHQHTRDAGVFGPKCRVQCYGCKGRTT